MRHKGEIKGDIMGIIDTHNALMCTTELTQGVDGEKTICRSDRAFRAILPQKVGSKNTYFILPEIILASVCSLARIETPNTENCEGKRLAIG
jgi:hypothetical protein